jgi:4-carboxymuconolactone decarboxylase
MNPLKENSQMNPLKEAWSVRLDEYPGRPYRLDRTDMNAQQRALVERVEAGPRGAVPINLQIWLHNPNFADAAEAFGRYVSQEAPIGKRAKEIIILVVAAYWESEFEWYWHSTLAAKFGITQEQIDAIRAKRDPGFSEPSEQITYEMAFALNERRDVSDELYKRAMEVLGHTGVSDLIGLMGLYTMIAHTINTYRVPIPKSAPTIS